MHITLRDLVSSIMIKEKRTEVGDGHVYDIAQNLQKKLGANGLVDYDSLSFKEFAKRNPEFDHALAVFSLKEGYGLDWLVENANEHMAVEVMEVLGLFDDENFSSI